MSYVQEQSVCYHDLRSNLFALVDYTISITMFIDRYVLNQRCHLSHFLGFATF